MHISDAGCPDAIYLPGRVVHRSIFVRDSGDRGIARGSDLAGYAVLAEAEPTEASLLVPEPEGVRRVEWQCTEGLVV